MLARYARALAVLALVGAAVTGCVGTPDPRESSPTPMSDEEAFAAAEATYRAYVDALNQVDLSDPATFEPVYALTTGDANAGLKESFSQMSADGWTVSGESVPSIVEPLQFDGDVQLAVCLDVSEVDVRDRSGASAVDADRVDVQSMLVTVTPADSVWRVSSFDGRDGEPSCGE